MRFCHCGDDIPDDTPPAVTSCKEYCDWLARRKSDLLRAYQAETLKLYAFLCALDVSFRDGLEMVPELD